MASDEDRTWLPTPAFVALREAWIEVPFDGIVPVGCAGWLQPLLNAVSEIVDPDHTLRITPEVQRRGRLASYRSKLAWTNEQIRLSAHHGMSKEITKYETARDALVAECLSDLGVQL